MSFITTGYLTLTRVQPPLRLPSYAHSPLQTPSAIIQSTLENLEDDKAILYSCSLVCHSFRPYNQNLPLRATRLHNTSTKYVPWALNTYLEHHMGKAMGLALSASWSIWILIYQKMGINTWKESEKLSYPRIPSLPLKCFQSQATSRSGLDSPLQSVNLYGFPRHFLQLSQSTCMANFSVIFP